jgi:hypothetical protein
VRLRLTLLYTALFLTAGAALLGVTYGLVARSLADNPSGNQPAVSRPPAGDMKPSDPAVNPAEACRVVADPAGCKRAVAEGMPLALVKACGPPIDPGLARKCKSAFTEGFSQGTTTQRDRALHTLLLFSLLALAAMTIVSRRTLLARENRCFGCFGVASRGSTLAAMEPDQASARRIFAELRSLPAGQLREELRDLEAEREHLREERATLIDRLRELDAKAIGLDMESRLLREMLLAHDHFAAQSSPTPATPAPSSPAGADAGVNRSAVILDIVLDANGEELSPGVVRDLLFRKGIQADLNSVRVALRRWVDRKRLVKVGALYRAPDPPYPPSSLVFPSTREDAS